MTKTHQLLDLMLSGKPLTYQTIMAETGWTIEAAKKVIRTMTDSGYCTHVPRSYVITHAGIERQKVTTKNPRQANTHQRLDLMRDGNPMTYEKIMAETGWTLETTKKALHFMIGEKYVAHVQAQYVITPAGLERQKFNPKTPRQHMDKRAEQLRLKRELKEIEKKKHVCETMVQQAVRTQPNSVFGLGAM